MTSNSSKSSGYENPKLREASAAGDLEGVKTILEQWRSDHSSSELTAKHLDDALVGAAAADQPHVVAFLLDEGAKLDSSIVEIGMKSSTEMFQVFLDHGWNINERTDMGVTSLRYIIGNEPMVRWFLNHGADPSLLSRQGESIVPVAAGHSTPAVLDMLLAHGATLVGSDALHAAASGQTKEPERIEMMAYLLDLGMDINEIEHWRNPPGRHWGQGTPLHTAVRGSNTEAIEFLLERGANLEARNSLGQTPLDIALTRCSTEALDALNKHPRH